MSKERQVLFVGKQVFVLVQSYTDKVFNKYKLTNCNIYCIEYIKLKYLLIELNSVCYKNNINIDPKKCYDFYYEL